MTEESVDQDLNYRNKVPKGFQYRLELIHHTGCFEWDVVKDEAELIPTLDKLKSTIKADINHYQQTGEID